jgi:hypothetical protein
MHRTMIITIKREPFFFVELRRFLLFDSLFWILQAFEFELRREYTEHYLCKQV